MWLYMTDETLSRCGWCTSNILYQQYHDMEWGKPLHDDRKLFELLNLEGAQAGLSWLTILKKREGYRSAFNQFNPEIIAKYNSSTVKSLLNNSSIVRNRLKIEAVIKNAKAFLRIVDKHNSFDSFIWDFVDGAPKFNNWKSHEDIPSQTKTSKIMSKELKREGFSFVGPTICYAYMQSAGLVNDHVESCYLYKGTHGTK